MARTQWQVLTALILTAFVHGCNEQSLAIQIPELSITPLPTPGQELLSEPVIGIELGEVPLFGIGTANFELENTAYGILKIHSVTIKSSTGGIFSILTPPPEQLEGGEKGELVIQFIPEQDEIEGAAVVELTTNAGPDQNNIYEVEVRGTGLFIGDPKLVINYGGLDYPLESHCDTDNDGFTSCALDPLDFGYVPIGETATQPVKIKNVPNAGTCMLPNLPTGEPDCTPACVITIDSNPNSNNLGIGFVPADAGFSLVGGSSLPFKLAPKNDACPTQVNELNLIRGELGLLVDFAGDQEESDHASTLVIESDAPNGQQMDIPIVAKVRRAPIAIAKLRECTADNLTDCSDPDALEPLMRVYLDGSESYDPNDGTIQSYSWEVIDSPPGTDTAMFQVAGQDSPYFSFWMPLTGTYKIKLTVLNDLGVRSAETETSIVEVSALPDSRLHIQLVWDSPTADLDLHLVYANQDPLHKEAYHNQWDCYWRSCRPGCESLTAAPCEVPTQWFEEHDAFTGPNPRLDIDDTNGFGPENINIDEPNTGEYHVYVHYYAISQGEDMPNTKVTIRVFGDGHLLGEFDRTLAKNNLWAVSSTHWDSDGNSTVTPAQPDGEGQTGSVVELPYLPPNGEGFFFGNVFD